MAGFACCKAVTSFLFSFSLVRLSVKGFKKGTGAFDLTMPSGRTGFLGILPPLPIGGETQQVQCLQWFYSGKDA